MSNQSVSTGSQFNSTTESINYDEYYDEYEGWEGLVHDRPKTIISLLIIAIVTVFGEFSNISAIIILVRRRLWHHHEGYFHLLAILVGNAATLAIVYIPHWFALFRYSYHISGTNDAVCKIWHFLAHVVFTSGWFCIALLSSVFFRSFLEQRPRWAWVQTVATKYCTQLGAKITLAVISVCFALMNMWQLWAVKLVTYSYGKRTESYCHVGHDMDHSYYKWEYVSLVITWYLPVTFLIPIAWIATLLVSRTRNRGFSFVPMMNDDTPDDVDFARTSLFVSASIFIFQTPIILVYIIAETYLYHIENLHIAFGVTHLVSTVYKLAVPIICLLTLRMMRQEVKTALSGVAKHCPGVVLCNRFRSDDDDINRILPLGSVQSIPDA